jgi:hypothetical protein
MKLIGERDAPIEIECWNEIPPTVRWHWRFKLRKNSEFG